MTRPTRRRAAPGAVAMLALMPLVAMPRPAAASDGSGGSGGSGGATPGPGRALVSPDYIPGPPCYGATCVGQSPDIINRQGVSCAADAVDLATVSSDGYSVTLRWSAYCHVNWARWNDNLSASSRYFVRTSDGHVERGRGYYTYMVNGNEVAQACTIPYSPPHTPVCTRWY